jgi:hypothetical protein
MGGGFSGELGFELDRVAQGVLKFAFCDVSVEVEVWGLGYGGVSGFGRYDAVQGELAEAIVVPKGADEIQEVAACDEAEWIHFVNFDFVGVSVPGAVVGRAK